MSAPAAEPATPPPAAPGLGRAERALAFVLLASSFALRLVEIFRYPFDSDEAQHLHVAWGWTQGLLPYRDQFDNHTPLFQLLSAPLVAWFGETPRILFWMRLAMLPIAVLTAWLTYRLGRALFDRSTALWGTVLLALFPPFFYRTLEYRTDDAWALLWVGALLLLLGRPSTTGRFLGAGVLIGAALAVSLKTTTLLLSLVLGSLVTAFVLRRHGRPPIRRPVLAAGAGVLIVPLALYVYFAAQGIGGALVAQAIQHNLLAESRSWRPALRAGLVLVGACSLFAAARWAARSDPPELRRPRLLLILACGFDLLLLWGLWPIVAAQTYLPVEPPLLLLLAHGLLPRGPASLARRLVPVAAVAAAVVVLVQQGPLRPEGTHQQVALLATVLNLTTPTDTVMDLKGETVYRRRAFAPVLETITRSAIERGLIRDTIPEELTAARTCVAALDTPRLPPRGRAFLDANFLSVGPLRVCGQRLPTPLPGVPLPFEIRIPATYALVTAQGPARGALDGAPYSGPRALGAGPHVFVSEDGRSIAVVWARATAHGMSPLAPVPAAAP